MSSAKELDPEMFRHAVTCFASGVTAITTQEAGIPSGLIATSVCSLSVDPATILICVNKTASPHDVILRSKSFAVNLLSTEQASVAKRFTSSKGADRFDPEQWEDGVTGAPTLIDSVVSFDCNLIAVHDGFTHSIMVGQIANVKINDGEVANCLLWHRHGFAQSSLSVA